jgi:hypothetical protein
VRDQGVNARLLDGRLKPEFHLAVLLRDRVVAFDGHGSERLPVRRDPVTEGQIIADVGDGQDQQYGEDALSRTKHR